MRDVKRRCTISAVVPALVLMILGAGSAMAVVKVAHDDGDWKSVYWTPSGPPRAGDTVIIATNVTGMPAGTFGKLIVRASGSISLAGAAPSVAALDVAGIVRIDRSASLYVAGNVTNTGAIVGQGTIYITLSGAIIRGTGTFCPIAITARNGVAYALDDVTFPSLTLASGSLFSIGSHDLTIDGPYTSNSPFGEPGITATTGTIHLNGSVYGTAKGNVEIGRPGEAVSLLRRVPDVHGKLGDAVGSVRFRASRRALFCTLLGNVTVDSGAVLEGGGLGASGENIVSGTLNLNGVLRAVDDRYRWTIDGDLFNSGTIENGTLILSGFRSRLRSDAGTWNPAVNVVYRGPSGGELLLMSPLTVARLSVVPASPSDSNIVVRAGGYVLRVRYLYTSDTARGCRVESDTVVSLFGAAHGAVYGGVVFEGFWGSELSGTYGDNAHGVRFATQKKISGRLATNGVVTVDPQAVVTATAPFAMNAESRLYGRVVVDSTVITVNGPFVCRRDILGRGAVRVTAPSATFDMSGTIGEGVPLEIGTDSTTARVSLQRSLRVADVTIHPGSSLLYRMGDSVEVLDSFRVMTNYVSGYNSASAPGEPFDSSPAQAFAGANSVLRYDAGYVNADTVVAGVGYYVRYAAPMRAMHVVHPVTMPQTISLRAGWNLIGAGSIPAATGRITVNGTTLLSGFVDAINSPTAASELVPGRGYWVNAAGAGTLTLNPEP